MTKTDGQTRQPPLTKKQRRWRIILWVIGILVAIRLLLPYVLLKLVNDRLAQMPGYFGHVEDLDLALIRGAYSLDEFFLQKVDSVTQKRSPFLAAQQIDLSVEWKALLHGSVVGELVVEKPDITFVKDAVEPAQLQEDTADFRDLLNDLMPIRVNRVEMHDGKLHYKDMGSSPKVDVAMTEVEALALNLRNSYDSAEVLPSSIKIDAVLYGGTFNFNMRLNPLADNPTFDMNSEMKGLRLTEVNEFMQAYANVDVNQGTFGLYTEIATKDRKFTGYVKPIIKDLDVLGREDRKDNFFRQLWEGFVGTVGDVLTNPKEDQVATKVEFSGDLEGPRANIFYAVIDLLRNAFIRAIQPALDNEVNIAVVDAKSGEKESFFQRLLGSDEKKDGPKKKKDKRK